MINNNNKTTEEKTNNKKNTNNKYKLKIRQLNKKLKETADNLKEISQLYAKAERKS